MHLVGLLVGDGMYSYITGGAWLNWRGKVEAEAGAGAAEGGMSEIETHHGSHHFSYYP